MWEQTGSPERKIVKAMVIHEYGGPKVLKFEEAPNPTVGAGEVVASEELPSSFNVLGGG